jgi:hypothetical protein
MQKILLSPILAFGLVLEMLPPAVPAQDVSLPNLAGVWLSAISPDAPARPASIQQEGAQLTFVNEFGGRSAGSFVDANTVVAMDWEGGLWAAISADGTRLNWANGIIWTRQTFSGGAACDSTILAVMDEWLGRAMPPQEPSDSLRYEAWGRMVGRARSANVTVPGPPITRLTRCEWLWQYAAQLYSTNGLGTLKDYVDQRRR